MAEPSVLEHLIAALRGRGNPDNEKLLPANMGTRGYQLHVKESQSMGETPMSYAEWIKTQQQPGGQ